MLDARIVDSIEVSVRENGQDAALSDKIVALVNSLAEGNVKFDETDTVIRHISLLFEQTTVSYADIEAED